MNESPVEELGIEVFAKLCFLFYLLLWFVFAVTPALVIIGAVYTLGAAVWLYQRIRGCNKNRGLKDG